ncbi:DUF2218 domain-containing protein [Amycolatopsis sp. SID8362]|uniref:DUF2218 domain-containing protein n=1 Tax=Amycolatopsis sp. SID8362 TaxID=2690346 RepID=UPI00136C2BEB|nr:DUF2218 domain-containing protein [Amycolatopsis sp. SID8362]NBH03463.1 DUF2218 domain-containing protein [Amycolatopsis sp. SID8362]NED40163.1 DUF2218 domain-containing protein [Amycolatopsis sp. SID8362]
MPVAEATVRTPRASRFLVQLCRHAEAMGGRARQMHGGDHERPEVVRVEWTDEAGLIEFSWGRCALRATVEELVLELDVDGDDRLRVIRDLLTADLERFGQREGLKVVWQGLDAPASESESRPRRRGTKVALVAAVVLAVVAHVVVGSAALSSWRWTSVAADILLAIVVLKIVVVAVLARRRVRVHHVPGFAAHAAGHLHRGARLNGKSAARQRAGHDGDRDQHGGSGDRW